MSELKVEREHMGYASDEQVKEYCKRWTGSRCWSCVFFDQSEPLTWDQVKVDGEVSGGPSYSLDGYCRCHSPKHAVDDEGEETALWPFVQGRDWCGEYQGIGIADAIERLTF